MTKIAILITGYVRDFLNNKKYIIDILNYLNQVGECDIYGYLPNKKEHSTKTKYKNEYNNTQDEDDFTIYKIKNFINFKKIIIYNDKLYIDNKLWGNSQVSYYGVKNMWNDILQCFNMINDLKKYDYIFRLRLDIYKFNDYSNKIISILSNLDLKKINSLSTIAVNKKTLGGCDVFIFSKPSIFKKFINEINENFDYYEKKSNYSKPEYLIEQVSNNLYININIYT